MPVSKPLKIPVEADAKKAIQTLDEVGAKGKKVSEDTVSGFNKASIAAGAYAAALASITAVLTKAIQLSAEFEQQQIAFETLAGDAVKGTKAFNDLIEIARKTPFATREVLQVGKQLLAFGFDLRELNQTILMLGDISAAVGRDKLPLIAKALADVKNKGKLAGQEFIQFGNSGVPLLELLSVSMGKTRKEITKLKDSAQISFEDVYQAMLKATEQGGKFADMMERQNQTSAGQWSEAMDNVEIALSKIGDVLLDDNGRIMQGLRGFNLLMDKILKTQEKENDALKEYHQLSHKEKKQRQELALAVRKEKEEKERLLNVAKEELRLIEEAIEKRNAARDRVRAIRRGSSVGGQVDKKTVDRNNLPDVVKETVSQEEKIRQEAEKTAKYKIAMAKLSADFTIAQGSRMMTAFDGQSRAMFNIGKALAIANIIMSGKKAVVETYGQFGYPFGVIPAGIMAAIYLAEANQVRKLKYNSGATASTAPRVASFSPTVSLGNRDTSSNTQIAVFNDLATEIKGLRAEVYTIRRGLQGG